LFNRVTTGKLPGLLANDTSAPSGGTV